MKTLILVIAFVLSVCIFSSCNKCDDPKGGKNNIYRNYNPQLDTILQYYANKNGTLLKTGSDSINLNFKNNYQGSTLERYHQGGFLNCDEYNYRVTSIYTFYNLDKTWFINLNNSSSSAENTKINCSIIYYFNNSWTTLEGSIDVNSKKIDSLINGKSYSNILVGDIANNQKTDKIIGKVLLNKDFGILAIKTDSLNLVRIP